MTIAPHKRLERSHQSAPKTEDASATLFLATLADGREWQGTSYHTNRDKTAAYLKAHILEDEKPTTRDGEKRLKEDYEALKRLDSYDKKYKEDGDKGTRAALRKLGLEFDSEGKLVHGKDGTGPKGNGVKPNEIPPGSILQNNMQDLKDPTKVHSEARRSDGKPGTEILDFGKTKQGDGFGESVPFDSKTITDEKGVIEHKEEHYRGGTGKNIPNIDGEKKIDTKTTDLDPKTGKYTTTYEGPGDEGKGRVRYTVPTDAQGKPVSTAPTVTECLNDKGEIATQHMAIGLPNGTTEGFVGAVDRTSTVKNADGSTTTTYHLQEQGEVAQTVYKDGSTWTKPVSATMGVPFQAQIWDGKELKPYAVSEIRTSREYDGAYGFMSRENDLKGPQKHRNNVFTLADGRCIRTTDYVDEATHTWHYDKSNPMKIIESKTPPTIVVAS